MGFSYVFKSHNDYKYKASRTESYNYIFAFQHTDTELGTFIANSLDTGSGGFVFAILELEEIDSRFYR